MPSIGSILASHSAHLKQLFGAAIPRLQHFTPKRPRGGNAIPVCKSREIAFAVADQHGAIEFRVAADVIVVHRIEAAALRVTPSLDRSKDTALGRSPARRGMRAEMEPRSRTAKRAPLPAGP
jgi:hypothetical protein